MSKNNIFIISGPSGAGEDSIIKGLEQSMDIEKVVTTTTRSMRPGEVDGVSYYFISEEEFNKKIDNGEFFEYAKEYNGKFYGVTNNEIERVKKSGKVGIWKIEYKGVITAKKLIPGIVAIFVNAPSLEVLAQRIRDRGGITEDQIKERLEYTKEWLKHIDLYDYIVVNENKMLEKAINDTRDIILKEIKK